MGTPFPSPDLPDLSWFEDWMCNKSKDFLCINLYCVARQIKFSCIIVLLILILILIREFHLSMLRKPLFRLGVRLCFNPSISIKLGSTCIHHDRSETLPWRNKKHRVITFTISSGLQPLRPKTRRAASPFVNWESESASQ
jgi:hypothetical protein